MSELVLGIWGNSLERLRGILEPTLGAQEKNGQVRQTTVQEHFAFSPLRKWALLLWLLALAWDNLVGLRKLISAVRFLALCHGAHPTLQLICSRMNITPIDKENIKKDAGFADILKVCFRGVVAESWLSGIRRGDP